MGFESNSDTARTESGSGSGFSGSRVFATNMKTRSFRLKKTKSAQLDMYETFDLAILVFSLTTLLTTYSTLGVYCSIKIIRFR